MTESRRIHHATSPQPLKLNLRLEQAGHIRCVDKSLVEEDVALDQLEAVSDLPQLVVTAPVKVVDRSFKARAVKMKCRTHGHNVALDITRLHVGNEMPRARWRVF